MDAKTAELSKCEKLQQENAQLKADLQLLQQHMQWVSIKDGLPADSQSVIICVNDEVLDGFVYWDNDKVFMDNMDTVFIASDIACWMPLPLNLKESE